MDIVYFNFSEDFNSFSLKTITEKLLKYGLDKQTVWWTEQKLNVRPRGSWLVAQILAGRQ